MITNEQLQTLVRIASMTSGEAKRRGEWVGDNTYTAKIGDCSVLCYNPIIAKYISSLNPDLVLEILQDYERLVEENVELITRCEYLEDECARLECEI